MNGGGRAGMREAPVRVIARRNNAASVAPGTAQALESDRHWFRPVTGSEIRTGYFLLTWCPYLC